MKKAQIIIDAYGKNPLISTLMRTHLLNDKHSYIIIRRCYWDLFEFATNWQLLLNRSFVRLKIKLSWRGIYVENEGQKWMEKDGSSKWGRKIELSFIFPVDDWTQALNSRSFMFKAQSALV